MAVACVFAVNLKANSFIRFCIFRRKRDCYYGETFIVSSKSIEQHSKQLQSFGYSGKVDEVISLCCTCLTDWILANDEGINV
jgi:hypothetical protein